MVVAPPAPPLAPPTPPAPPAPTTGAAEIAVPRTIRVVDALPRLGTGKIDYAAAGRMLASAEAA